MSAVVIEVPETLMARLRDRAGQEGLSMEQKALDLLSRWAQRDALPAEEFHQQVEIAREEMERFRNTFRELSR
jgi:plasmid stability protein